MARAEPWRLDADNYPVSMVIQSRFQDLDSLGHINNVAMSGIFETARVHFHRIFGRHPADQGVRWMVAAVDLKYIEEAHFPYDLVVCSGIGHIGNSSWTIVSAAFQQGSCVATCDTVMVMKGPKGKNVIDGQMRVIMEQNSAYPNLPSAVPSDA
ncbi:MAG: acyl-CoA thioesterase [Sphingomonadales bacterium]|nr:MAG: acyl-CoA thioesterase [Sphingomonadales bacterium]TNF01587.1 MAG: acyl-CoA thioesterase [Sphingomonadales bacterium]